jgi:hypothetical protein
MILTRFSLIFFLFFDLHSIKTNKQIRALTIDPLELQEAHEVAQDPLLKNAMTYTINQSLTQQVSSIRSLCCLSLSSNLFVGFCNDGG